MYCKYCGKQIDDNTIVCPYCGVQTGAVQIIPPQPNYGYQQNNQQYTQNDPDEVNVGIVVLSVFIPIVGIILGAVNIGNGRKKSGKAYLTVGCVVVGIEVLIGILMLVFAMISIAIL